MKSCERFEALIRRDEDSIEELTRHATDCSSCRKKLDEWHRLPELARDLHETWESPDLWSRVDRGIREEVRLESSRPERLRDTGWSFALRWAAVVLVTISLGVTYIRTLGPSPSDDPRARVEEWVLRESAITEVEQAEKAYRESIDRFSEIADEELDEPTSPLLVSYKEKLLLLDDAIAECEAEIENNRYNAHLRRQLLAIYDQKDRTLRRLLEERP